MIVVRILRKILAIPILLMFSIVTAFLQVILIVYAVLAEYALNIIILLMIVFAIFKEWARW